MGSTIPMQGPTPDAKLAAKGLASSVHPCFVEAKPDSGEGCIVSQSGLTHSLIANFPHVQSSLAVYEFRAAGEERCEQGHRRVWVNLGCLMLWLPKCIRTIAAM